MKATEDVIDESRRLPSAPFPWNSIELDNPRQTPVSVDAFTRKLADWPLAPQIECVFVTFRSTLTSLDFLDALPKVRHVSIKTRGITDFSPLTRCRHLDSLAIVPGKRRAWSLEPVATLNLRRLDVYWADEADVAWIGRCATLSHLLLYSPRARTLEGLANPTLRQLTVALGRVEETGRIRSTLAEARFQRCSQLRSVDGLGCAVLDVEACKRLSPRAVAEARVGCSLRLRSQPDLAGLAFVRDLPIRDLQIAATRVAGQDASEVVRESGLLAVGLPPRSFDRESVAAISRASPRPIVSNVLCAFQAGAEVPLDRYLILSDELCRRAEGG